MANFAVAASPETIEKANKINCIVNAKQHPCRKISTWVLIIFPGFVYSKSAIFKAIRNQGTSTGRSYIAR